MTPRLHRLSILVTFFGFILMIGCLGTSGGQPVLATDVLFVAPNGDDSWSGFFPEPNEDETDGPLQTLQQAIAHSQHGDTIKLLDGSYFETKAILDGRHSELTITAAPGAHPIVYGGRVITGWQQQGDYWTAPVDPNWDFRMLVVNDEYRERARLPQDGSFQHLSRFDGSWLGTDAGGWDRTPTHEELTTMEYSGNDLGPWLDINNAEIQVFHLWDDSIVGVQSIDHHQRIITFSSPTEHPPGSFWGDRSTTYIVWNVEEGLHSPGTWFLDRTKSQVVYWPKPGESMTDMVAIAPITEHIIHINGAHNVTISNIELAVSNAPIGTAGFGSFNLPGAIHVGPSNDITLSNLTIRNTGGWGIYFSNWGSNRPVVENCYLFNTGAGAIRSVARDGRIQNNRISHTGLDYPSSIAISNQGDRADILSNIVAYAPYTGISNSGDHSLIEGNVIRDVMQELNDGGGIYITYINNGTVRNNLIMNIHGSQNHAYYLDELAKNCLVENNVSINCPSPLLHHIAEDNTIRNNVFLHDGPMTVSFVRSLRETFSHNILYASGNITLRNPAALTTMPNNIFYSTGGNVREQAMTDYQTGTRLPLQRRDGTIIDDPMFTDSADWDFSFQAGSPALTLEIEPISLTELLLLLE